MPRLATKTRLSTVAVALALVSMAVLNFPGHLAASTGGRNDKIVLELLVAASEVIVFGTVVTGPPADALEVSPTAFLKGPTRGDNIRVELEPGVAPCGPIYLGPGKPVLIFLGLQPPGPSSLVMCETEFGPEMLDDIRKLTGQYAVPAASKAEGAGIDWVGTVLPVTGVVLVIFVIALYLMRIWHRIDPS